VEPGGRREKQGEREIGRENEKERKKEREETEHAAVETYDTPVINTYSIL